MGLRALRLAALLVATCYLAISGQELSSATPGGPTIITSLSLDDAQRLIRGMGFDCEKLEGKGLLRFESEGYPIYAGVGPNEFFLLSMFTDIRPSLEQINKFSHDNDFGKLYTDKSGMGILSYPVLLRGGVTEDNLRSAIRIFRTTVVNYIRFARECGALKETKTPERHETVSE